jgi:DNA-binding FadR family transcriptional regulator
MSAGNDSLEMEFVALAVLDGTDEAVGSARLADAFRQAGIGVAEATAGRYLRQLDERGLTRALGTKLGRVITEAGRERLAELRHLRRQDEHGARMLSAVAATDIDALIDLLYVRRAVEVEAARLAALRATDAELARLADLSQRHVRGVGSGQDTVEPSMHFHSLVAEASHNRMLIAVALLLLDPANEPLEKLLGQIARDAGTTLDQAHDHIALAEALMGRDADAAEATMRAHMDKLIAAVEDYRQRAALTPRRTAPGTD